MYARVLELVDSRHLKCRALGRAGSIPAPRTIKELTVGRFFLYIFPLFRAMDLLEGKSSRKK